MIAVSFYRIAVAQRLQPSPHFIYRMGITLQNLLLQWLCHLTIVDFLCTSANQASSFALGFASVILIFLIFVSLNTIYVILNYSILSGGRLLSFIYNAMKERDYLLSFLINCLFRNPLYIPPVQFLLGLSPNNHLSR